MEASILGEDEKGIGVEVLDNNGSSHNIGMRLEGEIRFHQCDGYADDPVDRTPEENEHNEQARRYARWYVARERGYDTLYWRYDPDRLVAVAAAVAELDSDAVTEYFGDLYGQVRSHFGDVDRPVALPDGARPGHVNYQQDVYLGLDNAALGELAALEAQFNGSIGAEGSVDSLEDGLAELFQAAPETDVPHPSDLTIQAVSGVHVRWDDEAGQYHHERHGKPDLDRNPDARFDILPFAPDDIEDFQSQLVHNLCCQVRDAYVGMGVTPPEPFRIQGLGRHQIATLYAQFDFYQPYHDPDADIDWEVLDATPATVE